MFWNKKEEPKLSSVGQKLLYGGAAIAVLAVSAPVTALALQSVTSLVMAGVVGTVGFVGLSLIPVGRYYLKIGILKAFKAGAWSNPIETLQSEYHEKVAAFNAAKEAYSRMVGKRDGIKEKLDTMKTKFGKSVDLSKEESILDRYSTAINKSFDRLKATGETLKAFSQEIEIQKGRYELMLSTGELAKMLKSAGNEDPLEEFLRNEAVDSIRIRLNTNLAEIDGLMIDDELKSTSPEPKQLTQSAQPAMIDVTERVRVN